MTYERVRAAHLHAVQAAMEDHVARLDWPRERIDRYRDHRLRALVGFARERSPFHARRLADLDPAHATVADLAGLPIMTKAQAQDCWDEVVTDPELSRGRAEHVLAEQEWYSYTSDNYQVFSSGGSSGVRGVYVWGWQFFVSIACLAWRTQARSERSATPQGPTRLAVLEAGTPPHASTPLFDVPTAAGMETVVIVAGAPFDEVLAAVVATRPTHLVGYPSVIGQLARAALAGELQCRPVRVSTNSEPLLDEDRQAIVEAWNVPVHNLWGSTEIGVQAVGCGLGEGLHICEDEVVLERVDENGAPVGPDEAAARTLATGLANRAFPSSATTSATTWRCCPARVRAAARSRAWPTSVADVMTISAMAQSPCPPSPSVICSALNRGSPNTKLRRLPEVPTSSSSVARTWMR